MDKKFKPFLIVAAIAAIVFIALGSSTFVVIKPGEKGIIFRPWGSGLDTKNIYSAGIQLIAPWNELYIYDVKEQSIEFSQANSKYAEMDVLDKNGLTVQVEVTVRFYPLFDKIGSLHEVFGTDYVAKLVIPEVRSSVRKVMGRYVAEEIYSTKRKEVEEAITNETTAILKQNNIVMTALLVRGIILPTDIKKAIEMKLKQEQEALAYKFLLDKETSEAERRRIEADGIARYNGIISASLTDKILQQKGIDATLELAKSPNTKVIVIGSSKDGLPMILGNN